MNARWAGSQILGLAVVGLAVGVVTGWISMIRADGAVAVADSSAPLSYSLAGLLPLVLIVRALMAVEDEPSPYQRVGVTVGVLLLAGVIGAGLACVLFLVGATQIPAVFGGEDAEQVMRATRAGVGWTKVGIIVAATAGSAVVASLLAHARAARK